MNRSQRRAAVIKGSIAAALLCGGAGMAAIGPAVADVGGHGDGPDVSDHATPGRPGRPATDDPGTGNSERPRRGLRTPPASGNTEWHPRVDWPCRIKWPVWPIVPPMPYTGNRNGIIFQAAGMQVFQAAGMQVPIAVLGGVVDAGEPTITEQDGSAVEAAPAAPPAAPAPAAEPPNVAAVSPAAPGPPSPAAPTPLLQKPESVAAQTDSGQNELPNRLQQTNLGHIATTALPGLAGIAALTALGGFLGYRQAKAGYVLRAAGTARFLR
ncbi:MAG: hypothetical protein ACR2JI_06525 [Mycobacterium sp.]